MARGEVVATTWIGAREQACVDATLVNNTDEALSDVRIFAWVGAPVALQGPRTADPRASVHGTGFVPVQYTVVYLYARVTDESGRDWKIQEGAEPVAISPQNSVPPGFPDELPRGIGETPYMFAFGRLGPYGDIGVDDIVPLDEFDEHNARTRDQIARRLSNPENFHFLFGEPGVRSQRDRYLYHYTKIESLPKILANGLRLSPMSATNDPLEGRHWRNHQKMVGGRGLGQGPTDQDHADADNFFAEVQKVRLKALSVSFGRDVEVDPNANPIGEMIDAPQRGYLNPAMWSHYGDGHTGACLILDRSRVDAQAAKSLSGFALGSDVVYSRDMRHFAGLWSYEAGQSMEAMSYLSDHAEALLFTKNVEWAYENEYRWVHIPTPEAAESFIPIDGALLGMVLGDKVSVEHLADAKRFADDAHIRANLAVCDWVNPQHFGANRVPTD